MASGTSRRRKALPPFVTTLSDDGIVFRMPDREHTAQEVRLWLDLRHDDEPARMRRVPAGWQLDIPRPPVQRLEYLYLVHFADGAEAMVRDPSNPLMTPTAFGDHSVLEFPGYRAPAWLDVDTPEGTRSDLVVRARGLRQPLAVTIWSSNRVGRRAKLPLLLLHDGPEFDQLGSVTRFASVMIAANRLPPFRLALLGPGERNQSYSASPDYARALKQVVVPTIRNAVGVSDSVAVAGVSLGALAALHAEYVEPGTASALFLQSGSFFRREHDAHESSFGGFDAIIAFVEHLDDAPPAQTSLDIAMTVGLGEENLANNRRMAARLASLGHRITLTEVPDAHTYVGWRDCLDPYLVELLARAWETA